MVVVYRQRICSLAHLRRIESHFVSSLRPPSFLDKVWRYCGQRGGAGFARGLRVHSIAAATSQVGGGECRGWPVADRAYSDRRLQDHFTGILPFLLSQGTAHFVSPRKGTRYGRCRQYLLEPTQKPSLDTKGNVATPRRSARLLMCVE